MARLELSVFSFDSRVDFQNGYVQESLHTKHSWHLKDLLSNINHKNFGYQEFGVNLDSINIRINNVAIFENIKVQKLIEKFGNHLVLEPLSKKYAKKDLLCDFSLALVNYEHFFSKFSFIMPSEREKLLEFMPLNFISENVNSEYLGDGFILYVRDLCEIYPLFKGDFLRYISYYSSGIFNHISTASLMFPPCNDIDNAIESMQKDVLNLFKEYETFNVALNSQYNFSLKAAIL